MGLKFILFRFLRSKIGRITCQQIKIYYIALHAISYSADIQNITKEILAACASRNMKNLRLQVKTPDMIACLLIRNKQTLNLLRNKGRRLPLKDT